jgi:hypothetical protein
MRLDHAQTTHARGLQAMQRAGCASLTGGKGGFRRRHSVSWNGSVRMCSRLVRVPEAGWLQAEGVEVQPEDASGSGVVGVRHRRSREQVHVDAEKGVNEKDSRRGPLWYWPVAQLVVRGDEVEPEVLVLHREAFVRG